MRRELAGAVLLLSVTGPVLVVPPAEAADLTDVVGPSVTGPAQVGVAVSADPGQWAPAATTYSFRWLRDGQPIPKATDQRYKPGPNDAGHQLAVEVVASDGAGSTGTATSAALAVLAGVIRAKGGQKVAGVARYTHRLTVHPGRYSVDDPAVGYQWRRGGTDIAGENGPHYQLRPEDVGHRIKVVMTVTAPGYDALQVASSSPKVRHRVDVRRTVRYHVETRGRITTSLKQFRAQAQQTYEDPRGWRAAGIRFVPVAHGGAFTLVLSQASLVPSFSSSCSAMWSCRVGRYVIINQDRWKNASPAWNASHLPLRDYRHMVVNHETGHWLGLHHVSCPGPGRLAPVMMQQSKGLHGCRFNPFPTLHEINSRTPRGRAMAYLLVRGYSPDVE